MDIAPVFDEGGKHIAFVAVERDVTERRALIGEMERAREIDERRRRERRVLGEVSEWLYAADGIGELSAVVEQALPQLVTGSSGTLFVFRNSRDRLEPEASWGGDSPPASIVPSYCWALRRGRAHIFGGQSIDVPCVHYEPDDERGSICVPLLAHGETLGMLHVEFPDILKPEHGPEDRADFEERRQLVLTCSEQIGLALANLRLKADLQAHATRDVLTGLPNRRWFLAAAQDALADAAPVALLSLDIDHFKIVNDTYGHSAGDTVLRVLASVMNAVAGTSGAACRIGGEEFVVLLPGAETAGATDVAETLRAAIEERGRAGHDGMPAVTISIGVAGVAAGQGTSVDALFERADAALYRAKREGRNRVAVA